MSGAGYDLEGGLRLHPRSGTLVHLQYRGITTSHDEQGRSLNRGKVVSGQIRAAATGDDGEHILRPRRRRDQGGRRPGGGTEEAYRRAIAGPKPVDGPDYPITKHADVETMRPRPHIDFVLFRSEQVEQQSPESGSLESCGNLSVAWAVAAAPAAMGENHNPA